MSNKEKRILFFSSEQKKFIQALAGPKRPMFYDGKEFTSNYLAGGKSKFNDAIVIFEGVPDPKKFSY